MDYAEEDWAAFDLVVVATDGKERYQLGRVSQNSEGRVPVTDGK
jgi:hypothetical protein